MTLLTISRVGRQQTGNAGEQLTRTLLPQRQTHPDLSHSLGPHRNHLAQIGNPLYLLMHRNKCLCWNDQIIFWFNNLICL